MDTLLDTFILAFVWDMELERECDDEGVVGGDSGTAWSGTGWPRRNGVECVSTGYLGGVSSKLKAIK